ncbi:serpin-ZXA-like [Rhododendron vialii]|uniref:serpin-ZXA-like n=1 Tax=Rhododendron vialii TaxID=182163 RepID=UPI00265F34E3|nr:serpin-ZXA-like [Rhododendron vialii]
MPVAKGGGSSNNAEDGPTVIMVNGVWVDERFPLRPSYKELIRGVHKCEAKTVDFLHKASEVVDEINSWADDASRGLIKDVLQPGSLSSDTAIVLGNGLYFKGLWDSDYKFDATRTKNRDFYLSSGNIVSVPFMTSHKKYYFGSFDGFKVLRIPYQGRKLNKNFSMYFFLPNEKDGLKNLVEKFNTCPWFLQQNLNLREVRLDEFWIPKFKFSFHFDVSSVMKDMGEPLTFLQNPKDWSDMMHIPEDVPIMKPNMIQKAYIEVDEKGTEAAAITIMVGCGCAFMSPPKTESFVADHPFMFMIKEETSNSVFFTGAVVNPNSS